MHDYLPEQMRCVITLDISMVTLRALSPFVGIFGYEKATEGLFFSFLILSDNWDMSICVFNIATLLQLTYLKQKMNKIHFNDNLNQDCGLNCSTRNLNHTTGHAQQFRIYLME